MNHNFQKLQSQEHFENQNSPTPETGVEESKGRNPLETREGKNPGSIYATQVKLK